MKNKRSICWWGAVVALLGSRRRHAGGADAMKDPLYGDPAHPNLSGMWNPEFAYLGPPVGRGARPPVLPGPAPPARCSAGRSAFRCLRARRQARSSPRRMPSASRSGNEKFDTDGSQEPDSVTRCLAFGMARFGTMPMEIIQTPGQITMNLGVLHDIRRIYLDGIGHTVGADPSFNGDSVGHWEGDTLVVETNNMRAGTLDRNGIPYSDKLTAVEKYPPRQPDAARDRDDADGPGGLCRSLHHEACLRADAAGQPLRGVHL